MNEGGAYMNAEMMAVRYLGIALIFLSIGIVLCFLASLGYNTYIRFQDKHKKLKSRRRTPKTTSEISLRAFLFLFIMYFLSLVNEITTNIM